MASSDRQQLVTLKSGFVVNWLVAQRLLDIEARGARFQLLAEGRFRVDPPSALTTDDVAFLRAHRDDARRLLDYEADAVREPA